jgi:flagellar motor switch protein FliG
LGQVETRDAILALCGLPVQVANAALAILPRAQAKTVRNKMNSLGSLNLREIDRAKEKVAEASLGALPSPALSQSAAA